jgi:hypothetical protein
MTKSLGFFYAYRQNEPVLNLNYNKVNSITNW